MFHALIIDDSRIISPAMQERLVPLGFRSFDHTWNHEEADAAVARRQPDIVIVSHSVAGHGAVDTARAISDRFRVPVLIVTAHSCRGETRHSGSAGVHGPFRLDDIEEALREGHVERRPVPPAWTGRIL